MKKALFLFFILFSGISVFGQNIEYNDQIPWKWEKNDTITVKKGLWYNADFEADPEFRYQFILGHSFKKVRASIQVFDMNNRQIAAETLTDWSPMPNINLPFEVQTKEFYRVFFQLEHDIKQEEFPIVLSLIKQKKY